jgi:hypothetical protein
MHGRRSFLPSSSRGAFVGFCSQKMRVLSVSEGGGSQSVTYSETPYTFLHTYFSTYDTCTAFASCGGGNTSVSISMIFCCGLDLLVGHGLSNCRSVPDCYLAVFFRTDCTVAYGCFLLYCSTEVFK